MKTDKTKTSLDPAYTFDNFVSGELNKGILAAAKLIEKNQNAILLYVYGETGIGKTHFLQAVGHQALEEGKSVTYATSEQLLNEFTENIISQTMDKFRDKYRNYDILLIDDIDFLANKEESQREFFHMIIQSYQFFF